MYRASGTTPKSTQPQTTTPSTTAGVLNTGTGQTPVSAGRGQSRRATEALGQTPARQTDNAPKVVKQGKVQRGQSGTLIAGERKSRAAGAIEPTRAQRSEAREAVVRGRLERIERRIADASKSRAKKALGKTPAQGSDKAPKAVRSRKVVQIGTRTVELPKKGLAAKLGEPPPRKIVPTVEELAYTTFGKTETHFVDDRPAFFTNPSLLNEPITTMVYGYKRTMQYGGQIRHEHDVRQWRKQDEEEAKRNVQRKGLRNRRIEVFAANNPHSTIVPTTAPTMTAVAGATGTTTETVSESSSSSDDDEGDRSGAELRARVLRNDVGESDSSSSSASELSDSESKNARKNEKDEVPDPDHVPTNEKDESSSEDSPRNENG